MYLSRNCFLIIFLILSFDYLAYVYIVIALVFVISYDAFPYLSSLDFDDSPPSILVDSRFIRRDVFDPYGFNTILTRFVKRNKLYNIPIKRTSHLINQDEYDFI
jgi:hypothetical protein